MTESSACNVRPPIGRDRKDDEYVSFTDGFLAGAGYLTMVANSELLVSVIIPCYKQASFLAEAIDSALAQSHPSLQVVVINDGSPDHTADVCRRYKNRITYVEQTNQGHSAGCNAGCRASSGGLDPILGCR